MVQVMKYRSGLLLLLVISPGCFALEQSLQQSLQQIRYDFSSEQQSNAQHYDPKAYQVWGLTLEDWKAYKRLMQGHRGILSPDIDPITALGVEAETEEERRRFAEIHVRFELQRTQKEVAFQQTVNQTWGRLFPKAQLINMAKIENDQIPEVNRQSGRLLFFTRMTACPDCDRALNTLLEQVKQGRQLDIFLQSAKNDDAIRDWAKSHAIPAQQVRAHNITLNHDKGKLAMISQFTGQVPYVAVKLGTNRYQQISLP